MDYFGVAEDAVDASESQEPVDDVVDMSGRWSSRSGASWSATGRRHGSRALSRRDTPRHVHVYKHDRGLVFLPCQLSQILHAVAYLGFQ